jgi:hypothetical protein
MYCNSALLPPDSDFDLTNIFLNVIVLLLCRSFWLIQSYTKKNLDYFHTNILRVNPRLFYKNFKKKRVIALILTGLAIPPQARINITNN